MNLRRRTATVLDEVARLAGRLADRLDPPRAVLDRARAAGHPSVVPDDPPSYASGRADLQLVHGTRRP